MRLHKYVLLVALVVALCAVLLPLSGCSSGDGPNPFAGNYTGTYGGGSSGTWTATIAPDGGVTLHVVPSPISGIAAFNGTGHVTRVGAANLSGSGGAVGSEFTMTWIGAFVQSGAAIHGAGTWTTNTSEVGTWSGDLVP